MKRSMIWLAVLLITGCSDKPGRGVLEEQKMTKVMWDLMQADEFATTYVSRDSLPDLQKERFKLYADVYRINGLDEKTFSKSYKYYTEHPDLMKRIFDSLTTKGEKERQSLYKAAEAAAAKPVVVVDSLKTDSLKKDSLRSAERIADSIKKVSTAPALLKKITLFPDTLRNKGNQKAAKARQTFLIDSLRNARIRKSQKPQ